MIDGRMDMSMSMSMSIINPQLHQYGEIEDVE